jgi:uncharacterized protein
MTLAEKREYIIKRLRDLGTVLVALSGGVDSSVVAALAYEAIGDKAIAVTFDSPLTPPDEVEDARAVAKTIGIRHQVHTFDELKNQSIYDNPPNRCYHCKLHRFRQARVLAVKLGIESIADGSTLSDEGEYRPGLQALEELGVISPLRESKITKNEARQLARELHLPVADKPSNSCLATRIPYNEALTRTRLFRIAAAEKAIREIINVDVLRVRDHGNLARIEVTFDQLPCIQQEKVARRIVEELTALGYEFVTVDLRGYRFGSFDEELSQKR